MGHLGLRTFPDTMPWRKVVGLVASDADVAAVAKAAMEAAQRGLDLAHGDRGLAHVVWLLAKITMSAREPDFAAALQRSGIETGREPGVFDIVAAFSEAVDRHLVQKGGRTDVSEMAQLSAAESLTALLSADQPRLLESVPEDVKRAAYHLSTKNGFAKLAHDFFARFAQRFLTYHLSRELSNHVGGNGRFTSIGDHTEFLSALRTHCREAALIVREFAGGWYSKHKYLDGVSPAQARGFVDYSLTKLRREFEIRGARDG